MKRRLFCFLAAIVLLFAAGEAALRLVWGFCDAPLYDSSAEWEYMAQPNQRGKRFGHKYAYNSFRQRSEEPDSTKKVVLGLGDSVINGGTMVDQDSLATTLLGEWMPGTQMLNISAGSWGPDNCAAYLRHYGLFGARAMVLVVSSHDAHDVMSFTPVVGRTPNYPDRQYRSAWAELWDRYLLPRLKARLHGGNDGATADPDHRVARQVGRRADDGRGIVKGTGALNSGFDQLLQIADSARIPMAVYLHADKAEWENGHYNSQGEEIIRWADAHHVPLMLELRHAFTASCYRDGIHLSAEGQRKMAEIIYDYTTLHSKH